MNQIVRAFKAWQYRGGRPRRWARIENRLWGIVFAAGFWNRAATLEVYGRKSGRLLSFPVAIAEHQGERYLALQLLKAASDGQHSRPAGLARGRSRRGQAPDLVQVTSVESGFCGLSPHQASGWSS